MSYKYEDKVWKDELVSWEDTGELGDIWLDYETEDVRPGGQNAIKNYLSPKIKNSDVVIALIGQDTHNSQGVAYEVHHVMSHSIPVIPVRIPNTTGAIPSEIKSHIVAFDPYEISDAVSWA